MYHLFGFIGLRFVDHGPVADIVGMKCTCMRNEFAAVITVVIAHSELGMFFHDTGHSLICVEGASLEYFQF